MTTPDSNPHPQTPAQQSQQSQQSAASAEEKSAANAEAPLSPNANAETSAAAKDEVETLRAQAGISQSELRTLALACETPCQLRRILALLASYNQSLANAQSAHSAQSTHPTDSAHSANSAQQQAQAAQQTQAAADTVQCGSITPPPAASPFSLLATYVDETSHDLREWLKALDVFTDWLQANNRPPQPLTMLLGYLACSAMAQAGSALPLPLPHVLADMLDQYGYDGDTAISTEP